MFSFFQRILDWFKSLFWKEEMELTLVGLQYSGKTTFVNVIAVSDTDSWKNLMAHFFCQLNLSQIRLLLYKRIFVCCISTHDNFWANSR